MPKRSISHSSSLLAHALYWNAATRVFCDLPEDIQLHILSFIGSSRPVKPRKVYNDMIYEFEYSDVEEETKVDPDSDYDPNDD